MQGLLHSVTVVPFAGRSRVQEASRSVKEVHEEGVSAAEARQPARMSEAGLD